MGQLREPNPLSLALAQGQAQGKENQGGVAGELSNIMTNARKVRMKMKKGPNA